MPPQAQRQQHPPLLLALALLACCCARAAARDYYDILSVPRHANEQQIKRAYRKLALQYHPDKVSGSEQDKEASAKQFAEISHAYETLSDPEKRRIYDNYGEEGLKQHAGQQGGGGRPGGNIFDFFFGGGGGGGGFGFGGGQGEEEEQVAKGDDVTVDLFVSLRDLYVGREVATIRDKAVIRPAPGMRQCKCKQKLVTRQIGPGMFQQYTQNACEECPNVALEREKEPINVHVEPGMADGQEITFFEEGEPMIDGEPGDLKFVVRTLPHERFIRSGHNLHMNMTISLVDALTGFEVGFEHLDGHRVTLSSAGVTRPGDVRRVEGEGMPVYGAEHRRGDLHVAYTVAFPDALSEKQKAAVRELFGGGAAAAA